MVKKMTRPATATPDRELDSQLLRRVIVEGVTPQVDEGRYPAKRTAGEEVVVEADVYADGHDVISAMLLWRRQGDAEWREVKMAPLGNDRFRASFPVAKQYATYEFTVEGWVDRYDLQGRSMAVLKLNNRKDDLRRSNDWGPQGVV